MPQPKTKTPFMRSARTDEGEVTIVVDDKSARFTVRERNGSISQVSSDPAGLTVTVDGEPRMVPAFMEKKLADSVRALGQCLRAKGQLAPHDYTQAAMVAFNVEAVNDQRCR